MGTITTKWGIRFNPMLTANSGPPFSITVGQDVYGTTLFNGRPGIATDPNKPGVVLTSYGLLILIRLPMNDCSPGTSDADRTSDRTELRTARTLEGTRFRAGR